MKRILTIIAFAAVVCAGSTSCKKINTLQQELDDLKKQVDESQSKAAFKISTPADCYVMSATKELSWTDKIEIPFTIEGATGDVKVYAECQQKYTGESYDPQFEVSDVTSNGGTLKVKQPLKSEFEGDGFYFSRYPIRIILRAYNEDGRTAVTDLEFLYEEWYFESYLCDDYTGHIVNVTVDSDAQSITDCTFAHYIQPPMWGHSWSFADYSVSFKPTELFDTKSSVTWASISISDTPTAEPEYNDNGWYVSYPYTLNISANTSSSPRTATLSILQRSSESSMTYIAYINITQKGK